MKIKSTLLVALVFLCLSCSLALSIIDFVVPRSTVQLWQGYYTLLVSDQTAPSDVWHRLVRAGLPAVTSDNTLVRFNDFASQGSVPVAGLSARFDSMDPRYDPYMKELPSYFHSGRWNIYYVRIGVTPLIAYFRLTRTLHGTEWKVADFNLREVLLCIGLLLVVVLFVVFRTRRPKIATLALLSGVIPWLSMALSGSYTGTLTGALIYLGWSTLVELGHPMLRYFLDYRVLETERLKPLAGVAIALLFSTSVVMAVDYRILATSIRGIGALLLLSVGLALYEVVSRQSRQHRLFYPVRISDRSRLAIPVSPRVAVTGMLGILLLVSPVIVFVGRSADVEIPTPLMYSGVARDSWSSLNRLWKARNDQGLPDLADYVAHRAYQAGLSYGRGYSFPEPDEHVYEAQYSRVGRRIVGKLVSVQVYSERWFKGIMAHTSGITRLIQNQPGVIVPTMRRLYSPAYPFGYFMIFWLVVIVVLLPSTFVRREGVFEPIGRLNGAVTIVPPEERIRPRRLPEKPWSSRHPVYIGNDRFDLVSEGAREAD